MQPPLGVLDRVLITTRRALSMDDLVQPSPIIYIDDIYLPSFDILADITTDKIESYFIDKSGNGEAGGGGGVIRIYTKEGAGLSGIFNNNKTNDKISKKMFKYKSVKGYEKVRQFYIPKYSTFENKAFENFGVIHWTPNIITNDKGETSFKILNTGVKNINVYIEGMGEDGSLYSTIKKIHLSD